MAWYNSPISHGYITDYQGPGTDTPHYAVDLAAPFHTPFSFPTSGTIAQADYAVWSGQPGGGEVFIKPDDGSTEQYVYHLDEIDVRPGQHVNAGQQVGLSGGENPGYPGAEHPVSPMWSSGAHIHYGFFQKYVNTPAGGRPYGPDPTSYLQNLSKNNGSLFDPGGPGWSGVAAGAVASQTGSAQAGTAAGNLASWIPEFSQDMAIRGVLILGGFILAFMGVHALLQPSLAAVGQQTQQYQAGVASDRAAAEKQAAKAQKQAAAATRRKTAEKAIATAAEVA